MNHPLNNRGWSEVRDRLCHVLSLAAEYLEIKIKEAKEKDDKQLRSDRKD